MTKETKSVLFFLYHIQESIEAIYNYLQGEPNRFLESRLIQKAILYELITIGEAANNLPDDFKQQHPEIPWRDIVDFRNVLAHHYWGVSPQVVINILKEKDKLPNLKSQVEQYINQIQSS